MENARARIGADNVTFDEAFERYAKTSDFETPIIAGQLSLGLATKLVQWSIEQNRSLSVQTDPSHRAVQQTVARDGLVSASLDEVKRLSDLVLVCGDAVKAYPRLGRWLPTSAVVSVHERLSSAMIAQWMMDPPSIVQKSRYVAVILGPNALAGSQAEQVIASERLVRWIRSLNHRRRDDGVHLGRGVMTVLNPLATVQEVYRFQRNRSLAEIKPADSSNAIRIGTSTVESNHSNVAAAVGLQIGGVDGGPDSSGGFIAANIAGWDHDDAVIRADGTMTLPVFGRTTSRLKSPLEILRELIRS